jgi:hypothetical protein
VIATIFIAVGGVITLTSAGSPDKVGQGKAMITSAIIGIIIALLSWVIINEVLIAVSGSMAGERVGKIFDWPWNQIQCAGGGITPPEIPPSVRGNICNCGENTLCGSTQFTTKADCFYGCSNYCRTNFGTCPGGDYWCCEAQVMQNGCFASAPPGLWCQRPAPNGSENWRLSGINPNQKGDAVASLVNFLNCMYAPENGLRNTLTITSISSDILCNNPSCDTSGPDCGHTANSCHYGGTNCRGGSHAVDFRADSSTCSTIAGVARYCGGSNAWINWETTHLHVSLDRVTCGCNESPNPTSCP